MIISRTPYRISLFGGGTDYPNWYLKKGGQVLSSTINKYIYISCRELPSFFDHKIRLLYAYDEKEIKSNDIQHPTAQKILKYLKIKDGVEIHYDGDLPARSGLGSSSAFTVGLLNALSCFVKKKLSHKQLANKSLYIEQKLVKEIVGSQDQVAVSYGGFNHISFKKNGKIKVKPVTMSVKKRIQLEKNFIMFYTKINRVAESIASTYVSNFHQLNKPMQKIYDSVNTSLDILKNGNLDDIGFLLDETWKEKQALSKKVSNKKINSIYEEAKRAGALGGKIIGAGGGGFLLMYVPLDKQEKVKRALKELVSVPIEFEFSGSKIIYNSD